METKQPIKVIRDKVKVKEAPIPAMKRIELPPGEKGFWVFVEDITRFIKHQFPKYNYPVHNKYSMLYDKPAVDNGMGYPLLMALWILIGIASLAVFFV